LDVAELIATALLLQLGFFVAQFVMSGYRVVGAIFQESDDRRDLGCFQVDLASILCSYQNGYALAVANS
jgi:hypothetical protein